MLNIFNLIGLCFNSALFSSSFLFAKLPEAYSFLNPIVDFMPVIPLLFFLLAASCCKFSMRSLILS